TFIMAGVQFSKTLIDFINAAGTFIARWGSVLKNPDRLQRPSDETHCAGVQFSKTLIDFSVARSTIQRGWGSVLKT
ncbi:hypothetical protein ACQX4Z_08165, partial [Corynebacterium diphtheriae]